MNWIESIQPWHWWILGVLLMIVEIMAPGAFLIWFGLAAFLTGTITFLIPLGFWTEALIFAVLTLTLTLSLSKWYINLSRKQHNALNDGASRFIGKTVKVTVTIQGGTGKVKVGDSEWKASGPDTPAGQSVTINDVKGTVLMVSPVSEHSRLESV